MAEKLSLLCFGDSLTAGYYSYGLEYQPYAGKLKQSLEAVFPNTEIIVDVDGMPGDLAISPPGVFLSRIRKKCAKRWYDWVVVLGGTNDLGYGNQPDKIYSALQDSWNVALSTGAKVLALTIPECGAKSQRLDTRRATLNSYILAHQSERIHAFDLHSKIPYHTGSENFREEIFDDGLHLTARGYDLMGSMIGEHLANLLKEEKGLEREA
ncbi:SGNH hydrolase [Penicillium canescens]|uniref:SGNH hydrolase n=1 Tax=Penicillium canescens TaxID=5083 RepID=A0AAD6IBT8_PENCN|nr:SGNH hydrolase [Penicillium canescens]KAJ6041591.1 SGNH hydrolase [Penicillium canescens]KAJ6050416.1 SGNH hydrolase [Penicillium canescens]KAJ6064720.1 SGNH hydrolase [Penicillium canescens]